MAAASHKGAEPRCATAKTRKFASYVTDLSTGTDPHRHTPGTHNHTQTPAEQGRRGQARQTHEVFRTRPTRRASKRARPTPNQSSSQTASPAPPARPESRPNPHPTRSFSSPAGRPQSPVFRATPQGGGAHRGRERHPHTQHTHPHTLTHTSSLTHPFGERWKGAPGAHSGLLPSANTPAPPRPSHSPSPTASARRPREPTRRKRVIRTRALARAKAAPQRRYRAVVRKER